MPIKVLIVDDSALMRALLREILNGAPDIEVVGAAPDPLAARDMIKTLNPDVITLDVEMPKMDGLEFLRRIMRLRPMPVVMISSLTARGSEVTLQALELGAVDFVSKPKADHASQLHEYADEIREKIRTAYQARLSGGASSSFEESTTTGSIEPLSSGVSPAIQRERVIAIGASTGGTEALKAVLTKLPAEMPPIVMVQHMPESFTPSFAQRLNSLCALTVIEAKGGERLQPGHAYLAPGHSHLMVQKQGGGLVTVLSQSEPVNRHRPAADVLFDSVAANVGAKALGVILTGMGKDGAAGLLRMRQAGAWNIGQDKDSCVVYGMPRVAAECGALNEVASLRAIPERILARLRKG
ncbi:MAG: protein-glutamate methylesterase/protein-glutamine glutaminase [Zoogloea sp.]|uniref:protein-glutamate methylesterase/protein-glutamine glutaminase n=1 Tax=Zoogloea sp. TaxID=49181 RepID=UPI003F3579A8